MADTITIDSRGTLQRTLATLGDAPKGVERARKRALRKLLTWVKRQVVRGISGATGIAQKNLMAMGRYSAKRDGAENLHIWVGTNPVAAQFLGTVRWTRKMKGARVGKRLFPGSWSWGPGSKTGAAVMERSGGFYAPISDISGDRGRSRYREGIREVKVPIHETVQTNLQQILPDILLRFETLMAQELRYALQVEAAR